MTESAMPTSTLTTTPPDAVPTGGSTPTVDWLGPILYEALQQAARARLPIVAQPWSALSTADQGVFHAALAAALAALDEPCLLRLRQGEPIFVLRAQDVTMPAMLLGWLQAARDHGLPADGPKASRARARLAEVHAWQMQHPELVKVPD